MNEEVTLYKRPAGLLTFSAEPFEEYDCIMVDIIGNDISSTITLSPPCAKLLIKTIEECLEEYEERKSLEAKQGEQQ